MPRPHGRPVLCPDNTVRRRPQTPTPIVPQWGNVTPFALRHAWEYRVDSPPDLNGVHYAAEVNEVKLIGGSSSSMRNDEQSEIARHWYEASGQAWNRIARSVSEQQGLDPWQNGRLFALVNIALADGYIANFESKYFFNFWRPVTAIRDGDIDGHLDTVGELEWTAYLNTPAIPEWPSGHATVGAAAAEVMERFFGTDYLAFRVTAGVPYAGTTRQYYSFSQASLENANSRVLAGIHFRSSCLAGLGQGQRIGDYDDHGIRFPYCHSTEHWPGFDCRWGFPHRIQPARHGGTVRSFHW